MVAGAVVIGGITRLTESGLSIVRWDVVKGIKPPRTQEEWEDEFDKYKQSPQFKYLNHSMTLDEFKRIFYMEYVHRMWGLVSKPLKARAVVYAALIGFQGVLGWWMVKSGLKDISTYSTGDLFFYAVHSSWDFVSTNTPSCKPPLNRLRGLAHGTVAMVFVTALSGAFVAGLDAGLVYNSFPKMAGRWIPEDILALSPKIRTSLKIPPQSSSSTACWAPQLLHSLLARGIGKRRGIDV
eukprot:Em0018g375a